MSRNKGGQNRSLDAGSENEGIRILKVWIEKKMGRVGRDVANIDVVTDLMSSAQAKLDSIVGEGTFQKALSSDMVAAMVAGVVQAPNFGGFLARILGVNADLSNEIIQEGADRMMIAFIDETSNALKGKNADEQKKIIDRQATAFDSRFSAFLKEANKEGLEKVLFDPDRGLAHKVGCKVVESKPTLVRDISLLDVRKRGGHMTVECSCVGASTDPGGTLEEALMRLSGDERRAVLSYIGSFGSKASTEMIRLGTKAKGATAGKLRLMLQTNDMPEVKKALLFNLLGYTENKKPDFFSAVQSLKERAVSVVTDEKVGGRFTATAKASARTSRRMIDLIKGRF